MRIIGGTWRGRKLAIAPRPQLRPSPDRVRETLFNWLSPILPGARCLDLFAGTGVLGFEAVSRGASSATMIDDDAITVDYLSESRERLGTSAVEIFRDDALAWLRRGPIEPFDIVFLDPPFASELLASVLERIAAGWLKNHAQVYLEAAKLPILNLQTAGWEIVRQGHTRHVEYALVRHEQASHQLS